MIRIHSTLRAVVLFSLASSMAPLHAQQGGAGAGGGQRYFNPLAQSVHWLRTPQIQNELELVAEQQQKIAKIREDTNIKMREMYKKLRDVKQADRYQEYYKLQKTLGEETERKLGQVLLPHQRDRLQQITLQLQLRSHGYGVNVLTGDEIAKELGITEEQKEKLRAAQRDAQKEFQQKTQDFYKKIRQEMLDTVLGELTPGQRQKLDKMMGEKYDPQPQKAGASR